MTTSTTTANFYALSDTQQDYFRNLASGDPERTTLEFFEDTVPPDLQDKPELLEVYLNGGTVEVPVDVHSQGRAGTTSETVEYEVSDKDWSHDVSVKNGGSDSADNGRFEDASVNRSRGSANTTATEQATADTSSDEDVKNLLDSVEEVGEATAWAGAAEVAGGFVEASLDGLLPLVGGVVVGKQLYDHFEKPVDKVGFAAAGSGLTVAALLTPPGQVAVGAYVLWNVGKRGVKLWKKHVAA